MSTPVIPFGGQFIPQIYRGGYSGSNQRDQLKRDLEKLKSLGVANVCLHGFPRELIGQWNGLAELCKSVGLGAFASWGLDGTQDNDGTRLTAREKGLCVGQVLKSQSCLGGLLDAEGRWDLGGSDPDGTTEAGALELGRAIREKAPKALVGDQPWPWIEWHGSLRRSARPIDQGGCFSGFPVDEFATIVNWGRFRQNYWRNWKRKDAYRFVTNRMESDWSGIAPAMTAMGLERPLTVTVQVYTHDERPWDLAHHLLERMVSRQEPVVGWLHPRLDWSALRIWAAVQKLVKLGFAGPGCDPVQAVKNFQAEANTMQLPGQKLTVDGLLGNQTIDRLLA